jgi:hypothetical protein
MAEKKKGGRGKRISKEKKQEVKEYCKDNSVKDAVLKFGISAASIGKIINNDDAFKKLNDINKEIDKHNKEIEKHQNKITEYQQKKLELKSDLQKMVDEIK